MRIIGIDPGTGILGFGVIDYKNGKMTLVDAGIIADTKPEMMAIEKLFFAQNVTTAMSVSHARGVAMLTGKQANLPIEEYTPMQIKQTMTGYGKADKKQMQEMVRMKLRLKEVPKPDDAADALATAIMCAMMTRGK